MAASVNSFGLHLGSTSCCLAVYKDGNTNVVANDAGDRTTPAIVAFTDRDQVVGLPAKLGMIRNSVNTICNVKQVIGRDYDDPEIADVIANSKVKIKNVSGKPVYEVQYKENTKQFTPKQIITAIYRDLMETASRHGDGDIHDTVMAVPRCFNEQQIRDMCEAATEAGFNILRVIDEGAASALCYDVGQQDVHEYSNVVVYRLGGTSLEITVLNVNCGMYHILSSAEVRTIGGNSFTDLLVEHFADDFQRKWKADVRENKRSKFKLYVAAENCKHILAKMETAGSFVETLYEGIDFDCRVTRARFNGLCSSLVQRCLEPLTRCLTEAGLTREDINKVIISGGSMKLQCLQKQLQDYFRNAEFLNTIAPDEVIAIGAAKEAAILSGNEEEAKLLEKETTVECLSKGVLLKVKGEKQLVFARLTPIPAHRHIKVQIGEEETSIYLEIHEGNWREVDNVGGDKKSVLIAKIFLDDIPPRSEVVVAFHLRKEGSLHVTATEKSSEKSESITIEMS